MLTIVSLVIYAKNGALDVKAALPYLLGGAGGGVLAGLWFRRYRLFRQLVERLQEPAGVRAVHLGVVELKGKP